MIIITAIAIIIINKIDVAMTYCSVLGLPDDGVDLLLGENVIVFETLWPLTDIEPDGTEIEYPDTLSTVNEYVPLDKKNVIAEGADVPFVPFFALMYHAVPDGRPVSLKVTVYLTSENFTALETEAPFTVSDPEDGGVEYFLSLVAIE